MHYETSVGITSTINHYRQASHFTSKRGDLWEYLLVANPDTTVGDLIMAEKQSFYKKYDQQVTVKTKPHITVANYLAKEDMEATIERWMQRICNQRKSFRVMLNNFGGFPPHTLYIRVQNPQPFQALVQQLKAIEEYINDNSGYPVKFTGNPHLTVARRLPDDIYNKALFEYASRDFHESFVVNELVLLKRRNQFDSCQTIAKLRLLPELDETNYPTQLNIFNY